MPAGACTRAKSIPLQRSRARPFFVCLGTSLSGLRDRGAAAGCKDSVQAKGVQVFDTWSEIQQLEEEIEKKMVSAGATKATERRIRDAKVLGDESGTTALHLAVHVSNVVLSECPWTRSLTAHARFHLTHRIEYFTYSPHTFHMCCRISDLNSLQTCLVRVLPGKLYINMERACKLCTSCILHTYYLFQDKTNVGSVCWKRLGLHFFFFF